MYMCLLMLYSDRRYKILLIVFVVFAPVLAFLGARGATIFFCLVFLAAIFREKVRGRHLIVTLAVLTVGQAASTSSMLRYRFESALSGQDKSLGQRQIYFWMLAIQLYLDLFVVLVSGHLVKRYTTRI